MSECKKQNYEAPELTELEVNGFVVMADGQASNQNLESGEDEENV